ncbi:MAG: hypothetical protein JWQ98_2722 [Chlorobi bacterium]|nr:hypothetical protein [Chlorobiota bacterium]
MMLIGAAGCGSGGSKAGSGLGVPRQRVIDTLTSQGTVFSMKEYHEEGKEPIYSGLSDRYQATLTFSGPVANPTSASFVIPISVTNFMENAPKLAVAETFLGQFTPEAGEWMKRTLESHPLTGRFVESITLDHDDFQLRCGPLANARALISLTVTPH